MNNSLKSFYLKLSNTGTVSSLAETVVCDFVPEHLLSYAKLNYSYTSDYKAYSSYVPDFLRNRPKDFVKHCLKAIEAASWYGKEQIRNLGKGCFQIKSEQSAQWYCVDLGDDQRFPSCECPSFQLTFLPCKHLFAIFNNSEYTWTMLSSKYTNSPYVTLDVDAVLSETQNGQAENAVDEDTDCISLFSTKEHSIQKTYPRCTENNPSNACVNSAQQFLREKLKILQDVSYLCRDTKALSDAAAVVHSLADNLKSYIPKENSLPLISTTQETAKQKLRKLPKQRKKIQSQARKTRFGNNYRCGKSADQPAAEIDCIVIHETSRIYTYTHTILTKVSGCLHCVW
ncbi:uncharacterized protein LOC125781182 [Astyanax mexicanus]|uniref:uncharacterized protein LOC125781182 n=1 Tax=Astyanax mexicanus TaxID=7994 RepID=UPI0020CB57DF|nr:uncharacterized protein LOC125781182 [Astyanax mexicanus]